MEIEYCVIDPLKRTINIPASQKTLGAQSDKDSATALGQVDTKLVVSASVLAGILSLLTSIAGLPECNTEE